MHVELFLNVQVDSFWRLTDAALLGRFETGRPGNSYCFTMFFRKYLPGVTDDRDLPVYKVSKVTWTDNDLGR